VDRRLGMSVRYGLGYALFGSTHGWGGWGGLIVMIEPDDRMAVAYVTNQMREPADDNRGLEIVMAAYDGLKACGLDPTGHMAAPGLPGQAAGSHRGGTADDDLAQ
jgi:CubicO group peptidase (beta-lactamase class C family)